MARRIYDVSDWDLSRLGALCERYAKADSYENIICTDMDAYQGRFWSDLGDHEKKQLVAWCYFNVLPRTSRSWMDTELILEEVHHDMDARGLENVSNVQLKVALYVAGIRLDTDLLCNSTYPVIFGYVRERSRRRLPVMPDPCAEHEQPIGTTPTNR